MWDSDLRPEGLALPVVFTYGDNIEAFVTPAYLVLSEHVAGRQADASMLVLQAGAAFAVTDRLALTVAPTYYNFAGLEGEVGPVILNVPSNSRDGGGNLVNDYDAITLGGELGIAGRDWMPNLSIFGEWVKTFDPESDNTGWLLGFSVGEADVTHGGDWRFSYNYRRLEADSWPDFLTDSDHFFGATNVRGSEFEFAWGIADGVNVSLDYYSGVEFLGTDIEQELLQLDLNVSW